MSTASGGGFPDVSPGHFFEVFFVPMIKLVSENILFRELLAEHFAFDGFEVDGVYSHLSAIDELASDDLVVVHVQPGDTHLPAEMRDLVRSNPTVRTLCLADSALGQEVISQLMTLTNGVAEAGTPLASLSAFVNLISEGFSIKKLLPEKAPTHGATFRPRAVPSRTPKELGGDTPADHAHRIASLTARLTEEPADADAAQTSPPAKLSAREIEVMKLLRSGASNKEIANRISVMENTVKVHLRSCYSKIGVRNRTQAALWAIQNLKP